jgi:hypothetical protein
MIGEGTAYNQVRRGGAAFAYATRELSSRALCCLVPRIHPCAGSGGQYWLDPGDKHWDDSPYCPFKSRATRGAKYVSTPSAPARLKASRLSSITLSPSSQPFWAAAMSIAYSPETW